MNRVRLAIAAGVLLLALILSSAAFSLVETRKKVMAAAAAEGRALLTAVSTGVEKTLRASRAVEAILSGHLRRLGRELDPDLASAPGREEEVLRRFAARERIKGALLLDERFRLIARARPVASAPGSPDSPLSGERLAPMVTEDLVRRVRAAGLDRRDHVVVFGENPFGTRVEFLVGLALPRTGGYLLLRHDAEELRSFRGQAGVERYLRDAAASGAVAWLALVAEEGTVLAASDETMIGRPLPAPGAEGWGPEGVLDIALPANFEGFPPARLRVGLRAEPVREVLARGRRNVLWYTAAALVFAVAGGVGLVLSERARRRREARHERERREQERSVALGRLAAGVAHEVRGPLNAIGMAAQRLERGLAAETPEIGRLREIVPTVRREVARVNRTVEEFLDLGRERPLARRPVDLGRLLADLPEAEDPCVRRVPPPADRPFSADPDELQKALANLLRNARAAAGEDGPVVVAWRREGSEIVIDVRDGGPGVPPEERDRIFEHFVSRTPGGTGLGLAIVRSVAARHGGRVEVGEAPEGGARFTMRLPDE